MQCLIAIIINLTLYFIEKICTLPEAVDYSNISELTDDEDEDLDDSLDRSNTSTDNNGK